MSRYMQPTKSYRNRLSANLSGSERIDLRRPTQYDDDPHGNGRITVFSDSAQTHKGLRPPKYLTDNNVYGVITTADSPLARKARQSLRVSMVTRTIARETRNSSFENFCIFTQMRKQS